MSCIKNKLVLISFSIALTYFLTACSVSDQYNLLSMEPKTNINGEGQVAIMSTDLRTEVLRDQTKNNKVGSVKSVVGRSLEIKTASAKPLAHDIGKSVCKSLIKSGYDDCKNLTTQHIKSNNDIANFITVNRPERAIQLIIHELQSTTKFNTEIAYDIEVRIFDKHNDLLGESRINGEKNISPYLRLNPAKTAAKNVPKNLNIILEKLFNEKKIVQALSTKIATETDFKEST